MSEISKRVVFIEESGGVIRFHDWALVNTALGAMMEPFCTPGVKWGLSGSSSGGLVSYDALESMHRIDQLQYFDIDKSLQILGETTIGGMLMPRVGR